MKYYIGCLGCPASFELACCVRRVLGGGQARYCSTTTTCLVGTLIYALALIELGTYRPPRGNVGMSRFLASK
jgi:hypothetical protein